MERIRTAGRRIGELSSAGVVAGSYVAVGIVALLLTRDAAEVANIAVLVLLAGYCCLRSTRRWDVFGTAMLPAVASNLAAEIFGAPRPLVGYPLAALSVAILISEDRREAREKRAAA